jgi:hypothetical protein
MEKYVYILRILREGFIPSVDETLLSVVQSIVVGIVTLKSKRQIASLTTA